MNWTNLSSQLPWPPKTRLWRSVFGSTNPAKTSYYVRVDEQPKLLLVPDTLKNSLNKSVFDLRDKNVVGMSPEQVDRVSISSKGKK